MNKTTATPTEPFAKRKTKSQHFAVLTQAMETMRLFGSLDRGTLRRAAKAPVTTCALTEFLRAKVADKTLRRVAHDVYLFPKTTAKSVEMTGNVAAETQVAEDMPGARKVISALIPEDWQSVALIELGALTQSFTGRRFDRDEAIEAIRTACERIHLDSKNLYDADGGQSVRDLCYRHSATNPPRAKSLCLVRRAD